MKCLAAVALMVVGISLPACAQHGASHGGFSGHSAPASHGGFGSSAPGFHSSTPSRSAAPAHFSGNRAPTISRGLQRGVAPNAGARPPYTGSSRYRRPYVSHWRTVIPYGANGWIAPGYLSYGDYGSDDNSGSATTQAYDGQPQPDQSGQCQAGPLSPYPPYPGPP